MSRVSSAMRERAEYDCGLINGLVESKHQPATTPALKLRGVSKSFDRGATYTVRGVTLEVGAREFVALVGGAGCGKTTLLKMFNRLVEPDLGEVEIEGKRAGDMSPPELRRRIGYVGQSLSLFPRFTVAQNVAIAPRLLGWPEARIRENACELLDLVGLPLGVYGAQLPTALSAAQRQRVGFACALAVKPRIVLIDEPFSGFDAKTRDGLVQTFMRLHRKLALTTVMATADVQHALPLAHRLAIMRNGELVAVGAAKDLLEGAQSGYLRNILKMRS